MSSKFINQVLELTNTEREKAGLEPLKINSSLANAAQNHSDDMADDDFFSHTGLDGSKVSDRVQDSGYQYSTVGENIAAGQQTAAEVVEAWMNSSGHRENILNSDFKEIGIGYKFLENDTGLVNYNHYWTQVFGTSLNNDNASSDLKSPSLENADSAPIEDTNNNDQSDSIEGNNKDKSNLDDLTGESNDSMLTGDNNAIDFNQAGKINTQLTDDVRDKFYDLLDNLSLGNETNINQNYDEIEIMEYITNSGLEESQQNIIRNMFDSFI